MIKLRCILLTLALAVPTLAQAETADEWIALGTRVHGGFGAFIPLGIRIGLDAMERLNAHPRELAVTYYERRFALCLLCGRNRNSNLPVPTAAFPDHRTGQSA